MSRTPPGTPHAAVVARLLKKRPGLAAAYLEAASEGQGEPGGRVALLRALRRVAKAQGMGRVAERAGIKIESLSRSLSDTGNPTLNTLVTITESAGLEIVVVRAAKTAPKTPPKRGRGGAPAARRAAGRTAHLRPAE